MGDSQDQDQDQYEDRLRELFNSFDSTSCGSLSSEELLDLCESLHLHDETPELLQALLQNQNQDQDRLTARVDFDRFKHALILVLSSSLDPPEVEAEPLQTPESPQIQPKFVKGSKRYGRRSTPEFMESTPDAGSSSSAAAINDHDGDEADLEDNGDSAVPRKRERWNAYEMETEEYEAEGQMHLWNPDEPGTPRGAPAAPSSVLLEERLRQACEELNIGTDGRAGHADLLELCERLGLEVNCDVVSGLSGDGVVSVQEFVSRVLNHNKPATPSSSTPYRQLKRLHSTQPFDEGGRRSVAPCALTSSIGTRLFSILDDGSGFTAAERVLDAWMDEGIENSAEILQALNFDPDGRLSLGDLTVALENELLVSKDGIQRAAVVSFRAEIQHLLERVDREIREKDKIRSDLEKAERLKTQFAAEVDEHHAAMEADNNLKLRKLEQEHREKVAAVRSDLMKELDRVQQQAGLQREELEAEIQKVREDEAFLRDHLSISVKENRRLEVELLDSSEKLVEAQSQASKLQTNLDTIMKDKFGDLDPGSADFFLQEERIKQLRGGYEAQCRELQDRIDELQSELQELHGLGRTHQSCKKTLSEELESKSPGMESDPGIGSEEVQPFSMSLEAEMMLEQLKEQHLQEMEDLRNQLENKMTEFNKMVEKQRATQEAQKAALSLRYQQEVQALQVEMSSAQRHAQELQDRLDQAEQERSRLERRQAEEREELENLQDEEVGNLRQQLLEAHNYSADLEEQLKALEEQQAEAGGEMEELRERHVAAVRRLKEEQEELLEARLTEARKEGQEEKVRLEQSLETERKLMEENHREELEEVKLRFDEEREEAVRSLTEEWQRERTRLDEQNNESLQALLEDEMLRLVREQEEKEARMQEQWEQERAGLREQQEEVLLERLGEERLQFQRREKKLREEWEKERLQLEEDYEGMIQDRLSEEREKLRAEEEEEEEERVEKLLAEEKERLQESHREAVKELRGKHAEERDAMSATLDKLRDDIVRERSHVEISFNQKLRQVEDRFSSDQETSAQRFQADVLNLEQRHRSELSTLAEEHEEQRLLWEAQRAEALENVEEQRRAMEREKERLTREWTEERREMIEELQEEKEQLQEELEEVASEAQTKEIELSRQLNELHVRLQESLRSRQEEVAQSQLLLSQAADDFRQERDELQSSASELQSSASELRARHDELLAISQVQSAERIELLTERDDLRMKIEELEALLKQAAVDFEQERKELQENLSVLEEMLKESRETEEEERDALKVKVEELEVRLQEASNSERLLDTEEDLLLSEEPEPAQKDSETQTEIPQEAENVIQDHAGENHKGDDEEEEEEEEERKELQGDLLLPDKVLRENLELEELRVERDALKVRVAALEMRIKDGRSAAETLEKEDSIASNEKFMETMPSAEDDVCFSEEPEQMQPEQHGDVETGEDEADERFSPREDEEEQAGSQNEAETCDSHPENRSNPESDTGAVLSDLVSLLEAFADPENKAILQESKPQDPAAEDCGSSCREDERRHETSRVQCSHHSSHGQRQELVSKPPCERSPTETKCAHAHDGVEPADTERSDLELRAPCDSTAEENLLLQEKIALLQQKTEILESLLAHNGEKIKTCRQILEENFSLKVKLLVLMEHAQELEVKALKMAHLQIRYEGCVCENAKLTDQNAELEKRVWILEGRINLFPGLRLEPESLLDQISRMRAENTELSQMFQELEREEGPLVEAPSTEEVQEEEEEEEEEEKEEEEEASDLEDCCSEFEKQNNKLRRAITELRDESKTLNETTQAHRCEVGRLSGENVVLRQKIATLKAEDLKEVQDELTQTLDHLNKEKKGARKAAETFKKQISELRSQNQKLQDGNRQLREKNGQNVTDVGKLHRQLAEEQQAGGATFPIEERNKLAACVCALEAELTKALEDTAHLEQSNIQLSHQLCEAREKALHSSGLQNHSKKFYWDEMSRLRQENERLQEEARSVRGDLVHTREKVRQLDATVASLKQQKLQAQSSQAKTLEQENKSLKLELQTQKELNKDREAGQQQCELESLQQENEALKAQMTRLSSQLLEAFQAQLVGLLPPSPHRMPRGQHRGEDPDNMQDGDREKKMKIMEERMREIELSLHNVKLLLREKVAQLKDQLHKNGKADVLIKDLYVENSQLLKALEVTEQRQKIAEKKNYLLEEKISSLNKIVRDLNPSPLSPLPYHYKCS